MTEIAIFDDKTKAQMYADLIHTWLIKNRPGYNAEKWCNIDLRKSDKAVEYYVKVPPDYEILNGKIALSAEKLEVSKDAIRVVSKLPDDWKTVEGMIGE